MITKIFSFVLIALFLGFATIGCSTDVEATRPWVHDEDLKVFVKTMENPALMRGAAVLEVYDDVGHKAKGYGNRANLFSDNTLDEAERIMLFKLLEANEYIDRLVTYKLNKHQRNALVSLVYNIGPTTFKNSAALKHLNRGHINLFLIEAFDKRRGFTCADGKYNKGLIQRRALEREIWQRGDYRVMDA